MVRGVKIEVSGKWSAFEPEADIFSSLQDELGPEVGLQHLTDVDGILFEFWCDDSGRCFREEQRNTEMEEVIQSGWYGPAVIMKRKELNDQTRPQDYYDLLDGWNGTDDLKTFLKKKMRFDFAEQGQQITELIGVCI